MVVQFTTHILNLIALAPKLTVFNPLLIVSFDYEILKIVSLLLQISINVLALCTSHFLDSRRLCVEDLDLFLTEVKLLSGFIDLFLYKNNKWLLGTVM